MVLRQSLWRLFRCATSFGRPLLPMIVSNFKLHPLSRHCSSYSLRAEQYPRPLSKLLAARHLSTQPSSRGSGQEGAGDAEGEQSVDHVPGQLQMIYTCKSCGTRTAQQFSKQAYQRGVVVLRCPGCDKLHLVADNLGWFGNGKTNIEEILASKGEQLKRLDESTNSIEISAEDIVRLEQIKDSN